MVNCHDLFQKFHDEIKLTTSKQSSLKTAKDTLRERVKKYFSKELKIESPKFWSQGSYAMGTIVNPLEGEYDIDDGIYLQHLDVNKDNWPTPETAHKWIYDAVKGHTKEDPIDKRTCIRVIYSGQYHVDIPIYGTYAGEYYLAEKGEDGWRYSDSRVFSDWFAKEVKQKGEQLRVIVRYFKAWADFKSKSKSIKLPSGLVLTVLVSENYISEEHDDYAFGITAKNIYKKIASEFAVYNPVDNSEILTSRLTDIQKENFRGLLSDLAESINKALGEKDKKDACQIWRTEFGDRFPKLSDENRKAEPIIVTSRPASPHGIKWFA